MRRSAPPSSRCVAKVCRSACGEMAASSPRVRRRARIMRRTASAESGAPLLEGDMLEQLVAAVLARRAPYGRMEQQHGIPYADQPLGIERQETVARLLEATVRLHDTLFTGPLHKVAHLSVVGVDGNRKPLLAGGTRALREVYWRLVGNGQLA